MWGVCLELGVEHATDAEHNACVTDECKCVESVLRVIRVCLCAVLSVGSQVQLSVESDWEEAGETVLTCIQTLSQHCKRGDRCAQYILTTYRIALVSTSLTTYRIALVSTSSPPTG